jgi:HAE1 family hydrophobic/amphiphilic exporter-1
MTAATTIIGLLPLSFGGASVAGLLYYPMARTVMGGLLSSVALTLVVLPYLSLGVEGAAGWAGRLWRQSRPAAPTLEAAPDVTLEPGSAKLTAR